MDETKAQAEAEAVAAEERQDVIYDAERVAKHLSEIVNEATVEAEKEATPEERTEIAEETEKVVRTAGQSAELEKVQNRSKKTLYGQKAARQRLNGLFDAWEGERRLKKLKQIDEELAQAVKEAKELARSMGIDL